MSKSQFDPESFKERLDACHQWPCSYTFKFIAKASDEPKLRAMLDDQLDDARLDSRASSKGKYVSVTAEAIVNSADEVMAVYERLAAVPEVIAL